MRGGVILVTGGAGFIGSNLVLALARADYEVVVCDHAREKNADNLAGARSYECVEPTEMLAWLDTNQHRVHGVVHLAGLTDTGVRDRRKLFASNIAPSVALWRWCTKHSKRFVYASSGATYGAARGNDLSGLQDLRSLHPLNDYGWSKHFFDRHAVRDAMRGACPKHWVGLKFFNVYGPREFHKGPMRSMALQIFQSVADGQPVRLFKSERPSCPDGMQRRDFVHVDDCVDVLTWALRTDSCGIFDVGTGESRTFLDLAEAVFGSLEVRTPIEFIEMPSVYRERYQYETEASLGALRSAGWTAKFLTLEEGIRRYGEWLMSSGKLLLKNDDYERTALVGHRHGNARPVRQKVVGG